LRYTMAWVKWTTKDSPKKTAKAMAAPKDGLYNQMARGSSGSNGQVDVNAYIFVLYVSYRHVPTWPYLPGGGRFWLSELMREVEPARVGRSTEKRIFRHAETAEYLSILLRHKYCGRGGIISFQLEDSPLVIHVLRIRS
jgi:hypothetical protein